MVDNEVSKAFVETRMGSSPISCTIVKKEKQGIATLEIMCSHTSLSLLKNTGRYYNDHYSIREHRRSKSISRIY